METLLQWVKKLAVFMILSSYMEHLLPTGYRRYFHMCMGLILILMIASPLLQISGGMAGSEFACLLEDLRIGSGVYQMGDEGAPSGLAENFQTYYMEQYKEALDAQIRQLAGGCGLDVCQLYFEVEEDGESEQYGRLRSLSVTVKKGEDISEAVQTLKKSLAGQLGLADDQIQVRVEQTVVS